MPSASVVLNLAEINRTGQKTAANVILVSTLFSMITVPVLLLLA
jgi:predicted permease